MNDVIANFFPESADELHLLNKKIAKEAGFIEVSTRSPRLSQLKSVIPVFVIPGLKPKPIESFYKQFLYPVFEAQYPENISSIDNLAEALVNVRLRCTKSSTFFITDLYFYIYHRNLKASRIKVTYQLSANHGAELLLLKWLKFWNHKVY